MKNERGWETKSLEWIHRVRKEIDEEINKKSMTPAQWIKSRGIINVEFLCQRMGLKNFTIVKSKGTAEFIEKEVNL
jgi:hypothetical protein